MTNKIIDAADAGSDEESVSESGEEGERSAHSSDFSDSADDIDSVGESSGEEEGEDKKDATSEKGEKKGEKKEENEAKPENARASGKDADSAKNAAKEAKDAQLPENTSRPEQTPTKHLDKNQKVQNQLISGGAHKPLPKNAQLSELSLATLLNSLPEGGLGASARKRAKNPRATAYLLVSRAFARLPSLSLLST